MPRVTLPVPVDQLERWKAAADRERLTLREWLLRAAELAIARGGTR